MKFTERQVDMLECVGQVKFTAHERAVLLGEEPPTIEEKVSMLQMLTSLNDFISIEGAARARTPRSNTPPSERR